MRPPFARAGFGPTAALALLTLCAGYPLNAASAQVVYDNGSVTASSSGRNMTTFAAADDFLVGGGGLDFNAVRFYAVGQFNTLTFPDFSGTVSWFVHADSGGAIPNSLPSTTIVASGSTGSVTVTPTGQSITGLPVFQLDFATPAVSLPAGRYWLRLKEGLPSAGGDGSSVFWATTGAAAVGNRIQLDFDEVSPVAWDGGNANTGFAFQLLNNVAAPEPGTLALLGVAGLPVLAATVSRRKR